ncbi:helix-turn-helix domain-containing protein [Dysgonomonas sp. ZJ709]|uniref:helix-turn-helix domain-containing protein n=1 Tax=Dysgonomonas sp. ZJ709 TaxID=2709797 RepID=UPI0021036D73|nr:helix-turn-helix domain-containing protein [Dysgonomonas sp. ZJ709]
MAENIYLTTEEVAIILRVSERTLYNYRECGKLRYHKVNNSIRYLTVDVVQFVNKSTTISSYTKDNIKRYLQI